MGPCDRQTEGIQLVLLNTCKLTAHPAIFFYCCAEQRGGWGYLIVCLLQS